MKFIVFILVLFSTALRADMYSSEAHEYLRNSEISKGNIIDFDHLNSKSILDLELNPSSFVSRDELKKILKASQSGSYFIPLELSNQELVQLAFATSLGIVAFHYDQEISDFLSKDNSQIANKISDVGNFLGGHTGAATIVAGSYFLGMIYENNKLKSVALITLNAIAAEAFLTQIAKKSFERSRPYRNEGPYEFSSESREPFSNDSRYSFWSGHAATAFAMATVISDSYRDELPYIPYLAYGLASVTAYARVHDKQHWASDVIAGAVAGHYISKLVMSYLLNQSERGGLEIYPEIDEENNAFSIRFNWSPKKPQKKLKCSEIEDNISRAKECIAEVFRNGKF